MKNKKVSIRLILSEVPDHAVRRLVTDSINNILIHMFQEASNSYWEAMNLLDKDRWLQASKEEFEGLMEMGVWKLVDHVEDI